MPIRTQQTAAKGLRRRVVELAATACLAACAIDLAGVGMPAMADEARPPTVSDSFTCLPHADRRHVEFAGIGRGHDRYSTNSNAASAIWKTITLGTKKDGAALRRALKAARCGVGTSAAKVLDGPTLIVSKSRVAVDLVLVSAAELGMKTERASLSEVYGRAAQLGLELCPIEVAPQLRLQHLDQPAGEFLYIAMKPVRTRRGSMSSLIVANTGAGLVIMGRDAQSSPFISSKARFVFVRPRQVASPQ